MRQGERTARPGDESSRLVQTNWTNAGSLRLISLAAAGCFLAYCFLVQSAAGAWSGGFVSYPDEPSHFIGAVMFRDWLASGRWWSPLGFAGDYYNHYPFFAVGYWPPLFSMLGGLWMLIVGVGRAQALVIPAVCAAGSAWLIFQFLRERVGVVLGICAGFLYLSMPAVREWMCAVMVDHVTAFLCLARCGGVPALPG